MKRIFMALLAIMAVPAATPSQLPDDLILTHGTYPTEWELPNPISRSDTIDTDAYAWYGSTEPLSPGLCRSVARVPRLSSRSYRYGRIEIGRPNMGTPLSFILDESKGTGTGYDTLYLDLNRNGDFTDDPRIPTAKVDGINLEFVPAALAPVCKLRPKSKCTDDAALDLWFDLTGGKVSNVWYRLRGYRTGMIATDRGSIPFVLRHFAEATRYISKPSSKGDPGDAQCMMHLCDRTEPDIPVPSIASIGRRLYALGLGPACKSLSVSPFKGPTGMIALSASAIGSLPVKGNIIGIGIVGQLGQYYLPTDGTALQLPAGLYNACCVTIPSRAVGSNKSCATVLLASAGYRVRARRTTVITLGTSLRLTVNDSERHVILRRGTPRRITLECQVGTRSRHFALICSDEPPLRTTLLVRDSRGHVIDATVRGTDPAGLNDPLAEFNCIKGYAVVLPKSLAPGVCTIEATMDVGTLGGVLRARREVTVR